MKSDLIIKVFLLFGIQNSVFAQDFINEGYHRFAITGLYSFEAGRSTDEIANQWIIAHSRGISLNYSTQFNYYTGEIGIGYLSMTTQFNNNYTNNLEIINYTGKYDKLIIPIQVGLGFGKNVEKNFSYKTVKVGFEPQYKLKTTETYLFSNSTTENRQQEIQFNVKDSLYGFNMKLRFGYESGLGFIRQQKNKLQQGLGLGYSIYYTIVMGGINPYFTRNMSHGIEARLSLNLIYDRK